MLARAYLSVTPMGHIARVIAAQLGQLQGRGLEEVGSEAGSR